MKNKITFIIRSLALNQKNGKVNKKKIKNKKYKWVVTGSSGFIGTNIVKKLLEHNQVVIGIDIKHGKI